jgi:hypothetical protein
MSRWMILRMGKAGFAQRTEEGKAEKAEGEKLADL